MGFHVSRRFWLGLGVSAAVALGTGVAFGSIPDSGGVIHACYNKTNGKLRVTDATNPKLGACLASLESAVDWNQQGPAGPVGATGPKGDTGATGPAGGQGPEGETGPAGAQGPKGDKGDTGAQGPAGVPGAQGPKGDTGAAGPVGATGAQGPKGDTGAQGPKGDAGTGSVDGYQIVEKTIQVAPGTTSSLTEVECGAGRRAVGGGWDHNAASNVFVVSSAPSTFGLSWDGQIQNNTAGNVFATIYAVCVKTTI